MALKASVSHPLHLPQTGMRRRTHLLYDVWVSDPTLLEQVDVWQPLLHNAAQHAGATILAEKFHQFEPHGVTGVLLLAESHISVHTWPEEGFAAVDVFTCGKMDAERVINYLRTHLVIARERLTTVAR